MPGPSATKLGRFAEGSDKKLELATSSCHCRLKWWDRTCADFVELRISILDYVQRGEVRRLAKRGYSEIASRTKLLLQFRRKGLGLEVAWAKHLSCFGIGD
jgi:hypothetical protein